MEEEQRNYYYMSKFYDRDIEKLKEWKRDGVTREEAKQRIDRRVLNDADVDRIYDKEEEPNKVANIKETTQTEEINEHTPQINEELEKLEKEKKKLQRKLAKTKIPKTFYIPTSKFEDLNNYFINKGRNISFSEQVNYAIDKLLNKEVNIELNTTGTELRKIIKEELENLSNNLFKYDFKTRKSNYAISYLLIFIMFRWFCDSKEDEESIIAELKEADELGYKMSKETDISITIQNIAKQLNLM